MVTEVQESWERLATWFETHAPHVRARLAEPATDADLRAVEQAHGVALPADLAQSWQCFNGVLDGRGDTASIYPGGCYPASTHGAIKNLASSARTIALASGQDPNEDQILADVANDLAGETTEDVWAHPPSWIVISEDPDRLFIDCRRGPRQGCVMKMFHEGGQLGPLWPSIAAMLAETAEILESIDVAARPSIVTYSGGQWHIPTSWWQPST
ncbi:SMI1/KNR4 family protein [Paractinoplanes toevensis]|nr:SMI1/KNR4 family protein [Actinoplanes toevensis]